MLFHATCVDIDGSGVLLRGPSGSGKSDLALRLIASGARLVGDDYVDLAANGGKLMATPPQAILGKIEARGIGILDVPTKNSSVVVVLFDLTGSEEIERLPDDRRRETLEGVDLPCFDLAPFEASACAKIMLYLRQKHSAPVE